MVIDKVSYLVTISYFKPLFMKTPNSHSLHVILGGMETGDTQSDLPSDGMRDNKTPSFEELFSPDKPIGKKFAAMLEIVGDRATLDIFLKAIGNGLSDQDCSDILQQYQRAQGSEPRLIKFRGDTNTRVCPSNEVAYEDMPTAREVLLKNLDEDLKDLVSTFRDLILAKKTK
jgi:hypothetical protein